MQAQVQMQMQVHCIPVQYPPTAVEVVMVRKHMHMHMQRKVLSGFFVGRRRLWTVHPRGCGAEAVVGVVAMERMHYMVVQAQIVEAAWAHQDKGSRGSGSRRIGGGKCR